MAIEYRGLKFWIMELDCTFYVAKIKALISCAVTAHPSAPLFSHLQKKNSFLHDVVCMFSDIRSSEDT